MARPRRHLAAGFTLIELIVAMSIMTMVMVAMGSVVMITSHALPDDNDLSEALAKASEAAEQVGRDLELATSFTALDASDALDPGSVMFTVPDRRHASPGPETIRYSWSGVPGEPLTQRYNGGPDVTVCENVHDFSLEYVHAAKPLTHTPRVLLIVGDDTAPDAQDQARQAQLESWGFRVEILDPSAGDAEYAAALADADVMYISMLIPSSPRAWVLDEARGIVCESRLLFAQIGISKLSNWHWYSVLEIVDNTHEITRVFPLGPVQIFSTDQYGIISTSTIAPDGKILGHDSGYDIMMAVDVGGALYGGKMARARRVSMPWGDKDFDFNTVTADGLTIMHRAIVWAAAPVGVSTVKVTLQIGPDISGRVETHVKLLNLPEAL